MDNTLQGFFLVVSEFNPQESGRPFTKCRPATDIIGQCVRIAYQGEHFQVALVETETGKFGLGGIRFD